MSLYPISKHTLLSNNKLPGLFVIAFFGILFLTAGVGISCDPNSFTDCRKSKSVADGNDAKKDSSGPTVVLDYSNEGLKKNPISSFMYFVPLVSPTIVDRETSVDNKQGAGIVSYKKKIESNSFYISSEFKIWGTGFHKNTFDPAGMIAKNAAEIKKKEPLLNMLDYIKFEGEGCGRIEVKGIIDDSNEIVTEVSIHFNARGQKSPVTAGLYSIKPVNGQYKYENRYDKLVARINTLIFKKGGKNSKMAIVVDSINNSEESDNLWGVFKGFMANFLIKPTPVEEIGNDTMLKFGYALLKKRPTFVFPKAKNLAKDQTVPIN